jgi:uncharacterized ion transporter superfamily protein YfcC
MISRLQAMKTELREIMVYQCPPELGDLYTRTEAMMERIKYEQSVAITIKKEKDRKAAIVRARRLDYLKKKIISWSVVSVLILYFIVLIWSIVEIRKTERPELGVCLIPKGTWPYEHYSKLKWIDCEPK